MVAVSLKYSTSWRLCYSHPRGVPERLEDANLGEGKPRQVQSNIIVVEVMAARH
jgi:hypothetical protein